MLGGAVCPYIALRCHSPSPLPPPRSFAIAGTLYKLRLAAWSRVRTLTCALCRCSRPCSPSSPSSPIGSSTTATDSPVHTSDTALPVAHHTALLAQFDQFGISEVAPKRIKFVFGGALRLLVLALVCAYTSVVVDEYVSTPMIRVVREAPSAFVVSNTVVGVSGGGAFANTSSTYQRSSMHTSTWCTTTAGNSPLSSAPVCPATQTYTPNTFELKYMCDFPGASAYMASGPSTAFACSSEEELAQSSAEVRSFVF